MAVVLLPQQLAVERLKVTRRERQHLLQSSVRARTRPACDATPQQLAGVAEDVKRGKLSLRDSRTKY
jgi:hypothetical protein